MAFRGLFIGIDRYAATGVNWLSCARRDAVALHALFTDTLGPGARLLTDEEATLEAIRTELVYLESADPDDVVVLFFSGHGAPSHHLVANDTTRLDVEGTGLALDELTKRFAAIPARRLICILDCCFSGGMGAKVLTPEVRARDLRSTDDLLDQMSGQGRVILTASNATQEAWEHAALGHGFLTYHLIEALLGIPAIAEGGSVRLLRVLEYVTRSVINAAASIGKDQHPTVRGTLEGDVVWPLFQRGAAYSAAFPDWSATKATSDLRSLERLGFPTELVDAWAGAIPSLNDLQLAAINDHGLLAGRNVLVSAPTSSGKTMIGELAALKAVTERRRSIFLLPMRALVNDKYAAFTRTYGRYGIRTIRATGEIEDDNAYLMSGRYDMCLMTNEKFAALALGLPQLLEQVSLIVVDETQMIADAGRGETLEFLLTMLKVRSPIGRMPQVVLLSAVIGDANGLDRWLDASLLRRTERPVPLDEGILRPNGDFRFVDPSGLEQTEAAFVRPEWGRGSSQDSIIPLVRRLVDEGQQVIVFRASRGEARGTAAYLARALALPSATDALARLPAGDPSIASGELRQALAGGVAFHISDLDRDERTVIEEEFRQPGSKVCVIAATTTLAMGINTPASAVVIAGLEHPQGLTSTPYTVAEYKNIVGRAGRLGFTEKGRSFVVALNAAVEQHYWTRYVLGSPEDIVSRFPLEDGDPSSLITRVLASTEGPESKGLTAAEVVDFLAESYAAFLRAEAEPGWSLDRPRFERALDDLVRNDLVEAGVGGRYQLTDLGRLAGRTGTAVRSVLRLVAALRGLSADQITPPVLITATQLTVELDETRLPLNRKSTNKEPGTWAPELQRQGVPWPVINALRHDAQDNSVPTMRAKRAVACLLWMSDWSTGRVEQALTQYLPRRDAAGDLRAVVSRTMDLVPTAIKVAEILHPNLDLGEQQADLLARLQLGLPAPLAALGRLAGATLSRGDYLALGRTGLADVEALTAVSDEALATAMGGPERVPAVRAALVRRTVEAEPVALPLYDQRSMRRADDP